MKNFIYDSDGNLIDTKDLPDIIDTKPNWDLFVLSMFRDMGYAIIRANTDVLASRNTENLAFKGTDDYSLFAEVWNIMMATLNDDNYITEAIVNNWQNIVDNCNLLLRFNPDGTLKQLK